MHLLGCGRISEQESAPAEELNAEEQEAVLGRLLKQIDFYFGDENYARDRFLRSKAREDPGGWIRLEVNPLAPHCLLSSARPPLLPELRSLVGR